MLLIPLGPENPEVRRRPWVTVGIVVLNVLVFLAVGPAGRKDEYGQSPSREWGFVPEKSGLGRSLTSTFIHSDGWHLAGNMVFLLATGPFLEDVFGRVAYPALYFGSAIAGDLIDGEISENRRTPRIGASGAISGVLGAFLVRLGGSTLRFFVAPFGFLPFLGVRVRIRAAVVLLLGFLDQICLAADGGGDIAFGAHVGGFAFGMLAAAAIWVTGMEKRWIDPAIEARIGWRQDPLLVRASAARFAGNLAHARRDVERLLLRSPRNADGWAMAARLALELGEGAEAVRCAGRAVTLYLKTGESDPAADIALEVLRKARPSLTPWFGSTVAALMARRGETRDALSIYEEVATRFPVDPLGLEAARRVAAQRRLSLRESAAVGGTAGRE
jgi:membrane associated rhomboid family serine protease